VTQRQLDAPNLPSLAPPDASDDERARAIIARMVARYRALTLEDYRRAYAGFGAAGPAMRRSAGVISSRRHRSVIGAKSVALGGEVLSVVEQGRSR
jgi:hypothetical protein